MTLRWSKVTVTTALVLAATIGLAGPAAAETADSICVKRNGQTIICVHYDPPRA